MLVNQTTTYDPQHDEANYLQNAETGEVLQPASYVGPDDRLPITETMEQVHKHLEKYLALHYGLTDERELMHQAIRERWGDVDPAALLEQAEVNSLAAARLKLYADPKKNKWVTTSAQGDMFHDVPLRVPSIMVIDGKPTPYYEASILDGVDWWSARKSAKKSAGDALQEAALQSFQDSDDAAVEVEKLQEMVRTAIANGMDPRQVKYARAQA